MKKLFPIALAVVLIALLIPGAALAGTDTKGNGLPKGDCYNLNIIGSPNDKNDNFWGGNGARIFVKRSGTTTFWVNGASSFEVRDRDGTDGKVGTSVTDPGITFPYVNGEYRAEVYLRLLGPANNLDNNLHWITRYDWDGSAWLQYTEFTLNRDTKFSLHTGDLLKDGYQNLLWELIPGTDFKLVQMRIYVY